MNGKESWRMIEAMIMGISDKDPKLANVLEDVMIKAKKPTAE